jgi:hypothetical protein
MFAIATQNPSLRVNEPKPDVGKSVTALREDRNTQKRLIETRVAK